MNLREKYCTLRVLVHRLYYFLYGAICYAITYNAQVNQRPLTLWRGATCQREYHNRLTLPKLSTLLVCILPMVSFYIEYHL